MADLAPNAKLHFDTAAGAPAVGWQLWTYAAGGNTLQATYSDSSGSASSANTNPIIMDARGECTVYGTTSYKFILKDNLGNEIWTRDNVVSAATSLTLYQALLASTGGAALIGVSAGGTVQSSIDTITAAASRTILANRAIPQAGQNVWLSESGRSGTFEWRLGNYTAAVASDTYQGLYVPSAVGGSGAAVGCWVRIWDGITAYPEWFGVVANSSGAAAANDLSFAACYSLAPNTQFGANDYWFSTTLKANLENHSIYGMGEKYTGVNTAVTRIIVNSGSATLLQIGPDAYPGSINACPQGINVKDIYFTRGVVPVIASNCRGMLMQYVLNAIAENVKTDGNMIGIEANGTIHSFHINCEAARAVAGSGGGTDYFIGHYANGNSGIAAGGNASLYVVDCAAGCNYGPLQTAAGSIGFKADGGFTDVWYWNPETSNFYIAQGVYGNDSAGLVFSDTDFAIFHPIHDQFHQVGIYVTDVATSGSVEIENPYLGPGSGSRVAYWVNSSEGAVICRGGQFVMGGVSTCQPIQLATSRGCDVIGYPAILEAGNTWPIVSISDVNDSRVEVFTKNPTVSAGPIIQLAGTCANIQTAAKSSGKASAFQYGVQIVGVTVTRSTFDVSGFNSLNFPAANRQLDNNGVAIVAAGAFAATCLAQGNFN